jgi:hypothetical protein
MKLIIVKRAKVKKSVRIKTVGTERSRRGLSLASMGLR